MADILTTSNINALVNTYWSQETSRKVSPLTARKTVYTNKSAAYDTLLSKLNSLKTELTKFNQTGTDSIFSYKTASSSSSGFVTATAGSTALNGSYDIRVNQLAKKDIALSGSYVSATANAITGTHKFKVLTGDGEGGNFTSNVEVEFTGTETNKTAIEKIQNAVNADKAVVKSDSKTGTDAYAGGASSFKININGTEKTITTDGSAGTYSELLDSLVSSINNDVDGVEAVKIVDPLDSSKYRLSITVTDSSKYISISHESGNDLVTDLNIGVTKEKAASATVSASSFSPVSGYTQLSLTAKESGLDYRIKEISDLGTYTALQSFGLNLGSARPAFNQAGNVPGFVYTDITSEANQLNSRFSFNGLDIQRNSNTVSDIAQGVTLNMKSVMAAGDTTVNLSVSGDTSGIKSNVDGFIKKFNDLYTYLKTNTAYSGGQRGTMYGDASSQALLSNMASIANSIVPGQDLNRLSQIGISFNYSTGLSITDSAALENKVNTQPDEVAALFNSENGVTKKLLSFVEPYIGSSGYLTTQKASLDDNVKYLNDKIKSAETRIDKSAEMLRSRYETLQAQLAAMLSIQSYFSF